MTPHTTRIHVREWVEKLGALDPDAATRLAKYIVEQHQDDQKVILDFSGVGTISSGFANELFVALAQVRPLDDWRPFLEFSGLSSSQAQVVTRSLHAARRRDINPSP